MGTLVSTLPARLGSPASAPARRSAGRRHTSGVSAGAQHAQHPRRCGRPSRLTPELAERLAVTVAHVGFLSTAARVCGLPPSLVCEWVARGLGRDPDRPSKPVYAEFADAVECALGEFEVSCLEAINRAALGKPATWRAAAWQLERAFPLRYGRRRFVEAARMVAAKAVEELLGAAVDVVERSVPPERRDAELVNLTAVADGIVGGIRERPLGE